MVHQVYVISPSNYIFTIIEEAVVKMTPFAKIYMNFNGQRVWNLLRMAFPRLAREPRA